MELLLSGHDKFVDLFAAIREARHHIHLEYFNFRNDSIANALFDLLAEKAKEGVEVRAMFDAFGNSSNNQPLKKEHLDAIAARGIEIVEFDPIKFPWVNHVFHRDHRKIVVIDGQKGYTGGMNVADYYINGLPEIGEWHDIHICIEGDAVRYLQGIFLTMWNRETGQHIGGPAYFPDSSPSLPDLSPLAIDSTSFVADSSYVVGDATLSFSDTLGRVAIVDRVPRETPRAIIRAYTVSIEGAREHLQIVNPYFIPTKRIRKALHRALKRGTEVEIMIPSVSDIPFTPEVSFGMVHRLMKRGAKIYLFNGGFYHAKVMAVDNSFCTVGTANLDSRSLRFDYETNAFLFDTAVTRQLNDLFEQNKQESTLMTPAYWKERSTWKKFVGWVGFLISPFL